MKSKDIFKPLTKKNFYSNVQRTLKLNNNKTQFIFLNE
jgi:hypothetical protein